ncbi:Copper fist DNA binding domain-containing protein [Coniochaeta hoffmannii]|uniref:Copper fist DNA binding domain-containing protein n=1 Tax=Coniochaeta hoffmannii TaxID=91930 RepID=A0AA38S2Y9_9PEZI|nr:Copper fist DNA binding domain-containing protein [Coniochaeta hoffmannii]
MPLINGQKMACAPCIRGHRSTKCNHASDRVMVPVRKPGRPLSSCACPPGQSCACGGIKVAIPRKQKCKCGLDTADGDHADHDVVKPEMPTPALSPSDLPVSPTRNGVFRVQKPAPSSRPNGRKQSFDPAHLARIDPNSINIVNPYNSNIMDASVPPNGVHAMAPQGHTPPMAGMAFVPALPTTGYQQPGVVSYGPPLGYALVPIHSHLNNPALSMATTVENTLPSPLNGGVPPPPTNGAARSCCAPAVPQTPVAPPQQQVQPPQPSEPPKKSCCGGGQSEQPQPNPNSAMHQRALSNGNAPNHFQLPFADMKQHQHQQQAFAAPYPNGNIFTYPANLGTWNQPLNPAMWAQLQQVSPAEPNQQPFANSLPLTPNGGTGGPDTSHECSCGPGCQCVGCLAHPFNAQTLEYVEGAWNYENDLSYGSNGTDKNNNAPSTGMTSKHADTAQASRHDINDSGTNGHSPHIQSANGLQQAANPEAVSPTQAQTPSDASGFNEELPASDFMFVNLPLYQGPLGMDGDSCGGSSAFCPCGDDCECVGCLVHNAQPLEPGQFEAE